MKIFIDADGCPVVRLTLEIASKYGIECIIVCDTSHIFSIDGVKIVIADKGADSADYVLAGMIRKGDIAVTQDYGLAAICLAKSAYALNQNGLIFSDDNINSLLTSRHIAKKVRNGGGRIKGPKKRKSADDESFAAALTELIEEALKN